jgi:hypothetical protein
MIATYEKRKDRNSRCKKYGKRRKRVLRAETKQEKCLHLTGKVPSFSVSIDPLHHTKT